MHGWIPYATKELRAPDDFYIPEKESEEKEA